MTEHTGQIKVFTTVPGAVITVGQYGIATNESPALVPEEVAQELEADDSFRVVRPGQSAPRLRKKKPAEGEE